MPEHCDLPFDHCAVPTVDEICAWLSSEPDLADVARETRRLRLLLRDLEADVQLLRQHVLLAIGEGINIPTPYDDHEPF